MGIQTSFGTGRRAAIVWAAAASALAGAQAASAIPLTWDSDAATTPDVVDGPGTWNTANSWWDGATNVGWTTLSDAVFGGTVGTPGQVTITTAITPNSMTFNVPGYIVRDSSTTNRLILGGTGGITANESAHVMSFRTAVMQTETQTWTVAPGKSFTMDATIGTATQQFIVGANTNSGKMLTIGGGGTVNFAANSQTFGLAVPQNATLAVNDATVTATGRTTSATPDDVAVVFRGRTGPGPASNTFVNTGGTIDVGTNVVTVQMNTDGTTFQPLGEPAELHLDGGTIVLGGFGNATSATPLSSTGALYFDGGEVRATKDNPDFMVAPFVSGVGGAGLSAVYVAANGANINTNGFDITVATPLIPEPSSPGGGLTKKGAGTLTMTAANTYTGGTMINAGTLVAAHADAINTGQALTVNAGGTMSAQTGLATALDVSSLTVAATGRVDLNDTGLVKRNGGEGAAGQAATQQLTALLKTGLENGGNFDWLGAGVSSTEANADNALAGSVLYGVGVIQNNLAAAGTPDGTTTDATPGGEIYVSFKGRDVGLNDTLVRYTYMGDADLDGSITGTDYSLIDAGFAASLAGWLNGDFDYSGSIDGTDYALIDNAFASQVGPLSDEFLALYDQHVAMFGQEYVGALAAVQAVPEPGMLGVLALGVAGTLVRRRRNG